jgi:hypothetical protein
MKTSLYAFEVVAALLAVGAVTGFVPNSCRNHHGHTLTPELPKSTTCFASEVDAEETSTIKFPFSDRQVRFAYDEWRLIYDKGDYDAERFKNFKANHKTLTMSNLKAREKSAKDGRPVPQWMSLNEYGDYSLDEYEAMMRGEPVRVNGDQSTSSASANFNGEEPVRATQEVYDYSTSFNNGQVQEYQDQFGRTVRSTQALGQDYSLESAASIVDSNYANNIGDDDGSQATFLIPKDADGNIPRGTQVVGTGSGARGTQVVNGGGSATSYGTQVVNGSGSRGTQVVASGDTRGTQVVASGNTRGTQVLRSGDSPGGTQVIQSSSDIQSTEGTLIIPKNDGGTQIIPKNDGGTQIIPNNADGGTQIIPKNGGGTQIIPKSAEEGTQIVSKTADAGTQIVTKSDDTSEDSYDTSDVGKRGTMVIKRSIEAPEQKPLKNPFNFFGSSSTEEEEEKEDENEEETTESTPAFNFFDFLSPKDDSASTETLEKAKEEEEEESKPGSGIFSLFGGSVKSANPRPVRTSISLQKDKEKKSPGFRRRRETKLIPDEAEKETGMPSILSFFGGAKKVDENETARNPNSRPTLIVKKPPKKFSLFSTKKTEETPVPSKNSVRRLGSRYNRITGRSAFIYFFHYHFYLTPQQYHVYSSLLLALPRIMSLPLGSHDNRQF